MHSTLNWSAPEGVNPNDPDTWTLQRDRVEGVGEVSTVWSPLPFAAWVPGTPRHFETLVFLANGDHGDEFSYVTKQEALAGHARVLHALQAGRPS